ncbi:glutamine--fructose-6-phosphate transaminase (isomerizing) (plasmid) [Azospirillum oryzae]|uniref:Glutamine--fructose-6-phosphate aminotransferase [isomerizing] n=1 Tax=Azospirillum oryzae TaxID=286727 RepID=A0A6N1ARH2_9PROT|nr:glutamine--fructose-6-phosphate transaminase (isomerizing) [Azospirillum oryzae]KAA0587765.1 glutamine--fructose-6-phosphate transaminase (isomerizing) [Azospirillum oryzae]QKS53878.1 glutamine--fructose-6-phosphate transaminase (isomerizing) [Azospirillum oryzae]GLR77649.1 glutamine--fructose-6-phosphate aminotransferase [isomerizing] [Azospirillum oryzae]
MCGIIGINGIHDASPRLVEGLRRLEYRGYDSAGVATLVNGHIERRRAEGKLANLDMKLRDQPLSGTVGIGHTRWATHGGPTENNAHPHATKRVAVVHNGIIENYQELKDELTGHGYVFESATDTEVIVHLVTYYLDQHGMTPVQASAAAFKRFTGAFALVLIFAGEHELMIGARHGTPLAVGYGDGEMYLASDAFALAPLTNRICYLEDGDWVEVSRTAAIVHDATDAVVERPVKTTAVSGALIGKDGYRHYMLKEIYEQPQVIGDTLNAYINPETGTFSLPDFPFDLAGASKLTIVACGTAYYAGFVAKYWFETLARIPVEVDIASEFRYREAPLPPGGIALFISQSGETLDTLEALRYCKRQGQKILSIVNAPESTIARESDAVLYTMAGPEIGVASTKAFTTQLTTLACLAVTVGRARGAIDQERMQQIAHALREVPARAADVLAHDERLKELAQEVSEARDVLYLGRGAMYPLALEGALKLKEISYIHAEGYAAGELKHGPIALIDDNVPVIVLVPSDALFEKVVSNVQEVCARSGKVLLLADKKGIDKLKDKVRWSVELPACDPLVAPLLYAIPVQLLAYHTAVLKGTDVDQPRNLAKSVTVE